MSPSLQHSGLGCGCLISPSNYTVILLKTMMTKIMFDDDDDGENCRDDVGNEDNVSCI